MMYTTETKTGNKNTHVRVQANMQTQSFLSKLLHGLAEIIESELLAEKTERKSEEQNENKSRVIKKQSCHNKKNLKRKPTK